MSGKSGVRLPQSRMMTTAMLFLMVLLTAPFVGKSKADSVSGVCALCVEACVRARVPPGATA